MSNVDVALHKKLNAVLRSPTPYQLRALVIDYLSHNCYYETARAFMRDSTVKELDADGDEVLDPAQPTASVSESRLKQIQQRREIRELILAGQVDEAIDMVNRCFPSVLAEISDPQPPGPSPRKAAASSGSYTYTSATSVEPSHLLLNLRLLAFIEICRTRPLDKPASEDAGSNIPNVEHDSSPDPNEGAEMDFEKQELLISKGRKLAALVNALPNQSDRDTYAKELGNVTGLLAYKTPEKSNISKYLSFERRVAVADQINRAILHRCGLPCISEIELSTRYTTALWAAARQHDAKPRASAIFPPSGRPADTTKTESGDSTELEELPLFDLKLFLDSRP